MPAGDPPTCWRCGGAHTSVACPNVPPTPWAVMPSALADFDVERIARRVVELIAERERRPEPRFYVVDHAGVGWGAYHDRREADERAAYLTAAGRPAIVTEPAR